MTKKKINKKNSDIPFKNKKRKISKRKVIKGLIIAFFVCCIIGFLTLGLFFVYIVIKSPQFKPDDLYNVQPSVLVSKDGKEFGRIGSEMRTIVSYNELPEVLVDAIVATEDSRFFQHNGFDLPRFLVASFKQLLGNSSAGGASTLTMQISKNKLTSSTTSIIRKFTDIYLAIFKIEKAYTKQEIIEFYVNSNYLGADSNGVEDASKAYFGKSVKDLNLSEAALITGLFNAPNYYDPYKNPEGAEQRRQTVLYLMHRHGYITDDEWEIAKKLTVDKIVIPKAGKVAKGYQGYIDTVVDEVIKKTGNDPYSVPMKIYTTMDIAQQEHLDKLMNGELPYYKWENDEVQGALTVIDVNNGSVSAIGAGRNRQERGYNYATMIKNQIGSTAKPLYDYGPGIEYDDWSTYKMFIDEPWTYSNSEGVIKNWDFKYLGPITMRDAVIDSRNVPAVQAFQQGNNSNRVKFVTSLGLSPEMSDGLIHEAHALGGYNGESSLTMAAAYNAFANGGYYIEPYTFTKIEYFDTSDTFEYKYTMKKVMSEETAYMITSMLIDTARGSGFNDYYVNGVTYAGKSGTTNLAKETLDAWHLPSTAVADIWAIGYTPKYTISAWYGYKEMSSTFYNKFGSHQNYRLFAAAARGVFTEKEEFTKPDGVVAVELERDCFEPCLPSEFTPSDKRITELFKKGTEPTNVSERFSKLKDVTNLNAKTAGGKVTLTWSPIETPKAIDSNYITKYYYDLYKDDNYAAGPINARIAYNNEHIGTIIYKIYEQDSSGNSTLVNKTNGSSITISPKTNNPTYIVKTSYTIFTNNMSDGASISVKAGASAPSSEISSSLQKSLITIHKGGSIPKSVVKVFENDSLVSESNFSITSNLDSSKTGTQDVTITVKYKTYSTNYQLEVVVQ